MMKRWFRWAGVGLVGLPLLLALSYGLYFALREPRRSQPQLIAHRGGPAHAPENTLAAFRRAIALGVDWIELDVQMSRDNVLVVMHDETVDRTTNGTGPVRELTLAQLRALDAGNGQQVPTFEEVLRLAKAAGVGLLAEIKSAHLYPGIEVEMVQAITAADYVEKTAIQSFEPQILDTIHALNPNIAVCPLYGPGRLSLAGPHPGQAATVCPMAEMVLLNPWMLRQAQAQGRQTFVWFGLIERPWVMRFILALGADGLMVDDPDALADILGR